MDYHFSLASIWMHGDIVTHAVALILLFMSILSWTAIVLGIFRQHKFKKQRNIADKFWTKESFDESVNSIADNSSPWKMLAIEGKYAVHGFNSGGYQTQNPNTIGDWIMRGQMNVLDRVTFYQNYGLVLLSSIGATAPFIGLLGTVWGIYHTLITLSGGGQMSIDQVAGPIGEALVMTAFGLVVAIPAVLGNNAITSCNRRNLQELDIFAQDLQAFLVTGQRPLSAKRQGPEKE